MKQTDATYAEQRLEVPSGYEELFTHFYSAANHTAGPVTKTLLPSFQTILVFNFGAAATLDAAPGARIGLNKCLVLGPIKRAFQYTLQPGAALLVINFRDDAFYRFFGSSAIAEQQPLHPDDLVPGNCFTALWTVLSGMDNAARQITYILEFARPYLRPRNPIAGQLSTFGDETKDPIKSVASLNRQTERNIQLSHKKYLGFSAREKSRYERFLKAINLLQTHTSPGSRVSWFDIIQACGYYDQSQLINDFRHYVGISPTRYLKFQQQICNPRG